MKLGNPLSGSAARSTSFLAKRAFWGAVLAAAPLLLAQVAACSGDDDDNGSAGKGGTGATGGAGGSGGSDASNQGGFAVCDPTDTCKAADGGRIQLTVDPAECHPDAAAEEQGDGGGDGYPATNCGNEADDDDCKYHVKVTSTPIIKDQDVTLTVQLTNVVGGAAVSGNALKSMEQRTVEGVHIGPVEATFTETPANSGVYKTSPIKFDASGRWLIRFHIREDCADSPTSPHGHIAFFIDVP